MNTYGYFDDEDREYVITNPRTPVKWTNYIGTLEFGGLVDHTGGAVICAGDPALNRIVKYIPQLPDSSFKGETLYLRVHREDGFKIFSPFFVPTRDPYSLYECHVGLGYQRIVSVFYGIRTEVTIFVPIGGQVELREIRVTNETDNPMELDVIPVVEFSHFDALKQFNNADWVPQTMMCDARHDPAGYLILEQYAFMRREQAINYFTSNHIAASFQTDRKAFLGENGYGTWQLPRELLNEKLSNTEARRGDVIAALHHALGLVLPGETRAIITQLGQAKRMDIPGLIAPYREPEAVADALRELRAFWDEYLKRFACVTPDAAFNSIVNIHNPRQCHTTLNWSRYLSLYQLGLGARGLGFRDSSQDVMGVLASAPAAAKGLLRKLLSVQNPDGSAMHQFFPLTMEASGGDAQEEGDERVYGDDHLWCVLAVCAYLKETGDYPFLSETISFYDAALPSTDRESQSVMEHLTRALAYTKTHTGQHGLPLLGFADWNDTVNLPGAAESLFIANLYGRALLEMIDLLDFLGEETRAHAYRADHARMSELVNTHAWDGDWYVRYFTESGEALGSRKNAKGQIYTNGQSWPILSGFAPADRARRALDAVYERLNTACGIKLSTPGYDGYEPEVGGVTTYPPGAKENGGIFLHSNPWVMIAETMLGNGDRAFRYYQQINPAARNNEIDRYECEPYCYAQNILGDEHPQFGLGRNSWLSGTASWTYQAATQYILGIRPRHDGLDIDPCIPAAWDGFTVTRVFRGTTYKIAVSNPEHISKGAMALVVDGQEIKGQTVPIFDDDRIHCIEATMVSVREDSKTTSLVVESDHVLSEAVCMGM